MWFLAGALRTIDAVRRRDLALGLTIGAVFVALFVHSLFYSGFVEDPITWVAVALAAWPGQCRAVGIRRVGGGEHQRERFLRRLAEGAQPLFRARHRELRAAQAGDEISAASAAGVLHRLEHRVDGGKSAGNLFGLRGFASDDPMPGEQRLRQRRGAFGRGPTRFGQERPAPFAAWRRDGHIEFLRLRHEAAALSER